MTTTTMILTDHGRRAFSPSLVRTRVKGMTMRLGKSLASLLIICVASPVGAQSPGVDFKTERLRVDSGVHDGASEMRVAFQDTVNFSGVPWMRLHVAEYYLGRRSHIIVRSWLDGDEQRLDAKLLPIWQNTTAMLNGDAIEVELHVAPGDKGVFVKFDEMIGGNCAGAEPVEGGLRDICGADSRNRSFDNRVGRISGCTAWFITNGAFLTAGHCVDTDKDADGDPDPDGVWDLAGIVEFNVPLSAANGRADVAAVEDQYPVQATYRRYRFDGGNTLGRDWAVFAVGLNDEHDEMPWERYGTIGFRPSRENPHEGDRIRITGFGVDNTPAGTGSPDGGGGCLGLASCCTESGGDCTCDCNSRSRTNQTSTGPFVEQNFDNSNKISLVYRVDSMPASSGSPIIWAQLRGDVAVGIHTSGACGDDGNAGTAFEVNVLGRALRDFTSPLAVFVDKGHPYSASLGNGTIVRPYETVAEAVAGVETGGVISMVAGIYFAEDGNTFTAGADGKAMTFEAPVGTVSIGH
ncbi:MAG: hypothetical protein JSU63_03545 [Phycisphaerales bacterium]|nr:MAG: hypothetical protein JSU63_03545 [Phycisphaerales bacterium]